MKRETYVKRLVTSYKNLSNEEKKMFLNETELMTFPKETPNIPEEDVEDRA